MKIAANLSYMWPELPYLDRFDAAAEAGFDGVEVMFPYEMPAKETQRALLRAGLPMVLITAPPPNYTGGARGFAAVAGAEDRFRYDLRRALRYCDALRTPVLQILAGVAEGPAARRTLVANLKTAADAAPKGLLITVSPTNSTDRPGVFLDSYELAAEILQEVGAPNLGLQFNSHEAEVLHGDPVAVLERYAGLISHVQIADAPGGAADLAAMARGLMDIDYRGWVGVLHDRAALPDVHRKHLRSLRG